MIQRALDVYRQAHARGFVAKVSEQIVSMATEDTVSVGRWLASLSDTVEWSEDRDWAARKERFLLMLRDSVNTTKKCPFCDQKAAVWKKCVISTAAIDLVRLVKRYRGKPLHIEDFTHKLKDRNFSQLVLWGLVVPAVNDDDSKRSSGMWSPTQRGKDFVAGDLLLSKYVITYANEVVDREGPEHSIRDALGQHYDHAKLLNGYVDL